MAELYKERTKLGEIPGLVLELPSRFKEIPSGFPDRQPDRLVGVLLETDANRLCFLDKMTKAIKDGKHVAAIHTDTDWLKYWNEAYSRELGDKAITHSACAVAKIIDEVFPEEEGIEVVIFRADQAADESWFFILGFSEDKIKLMDKLRAKLSTCPPVPLSKSLAKKISFSWGVSHTGEETYNAFLRETREALESGTLTKPYDLFNQLRDEAKSRMAKMKMEKVLRILQKAVARPKVAEFIEMISEELGGTRLSPAILHFILLHTARQAIKEKGHG